MKMTSLEEVKKNLLGIETEESEFENEVICAFEDYEFQGETEVIVDKSHEKTNIEGYGQCEMWKAYINHENAPVIGFAVNEIWNENEDITIYQVIEVF